MENIELSSEQATMRGKKYTSQIKKREREKES